MVLPDCFEVRDSPYHHALLAMLRFPFQPEIIGGATLYVFYICHCAPTHSSPIFTSSGFSLNCNSDT